MDMEPVLARRQASYLCLDAQAATGFNEDDLPTDRKSVV
jgi:hypothetical protein